MAYSKESKKIGTVRNVFYRQVRKQKKPAGKYAVVGSTPYGKGVKVIKDKNEITQKYNKNWDAWVAMSHPNYDPDEPAEKFLPSNNSQQGVLFEFEAIRSREDGRIAYKEELKSRYKQIEDLHEDLKALLDNDVKDECESIKIKIKKEINK